MTLNDAHLPRLAISRCLLGHPVRYDGGHKYHYFIAGVLAARLPSWPLCPELEAGLGAPRPAVQLQDTGSVVRLVTVSGTQDVSARLQDACRRFQAVLPQIDGLILKSRSPSCAIDDAQLWRPSWESSPAVSGMATVGAGSGPGFLLRSGVVPSSLPAISDVRLADAEQRRIFIEAIFRHWRHRQHEIALERLEYALQVAAGLLSAPYATG